MCYPGIIRGGTEQNANLIQCGHCRIRDNCACAECRYRSETSQLEPSCWLRATCQSHRIPLEFSGESCRLQWRVFIGYLTPLGAPRANSRAKVCQKGVSEHIDTRRATGLHVFLANKDKNAASSFPCCSVFNASFSVTLPFLCVPFRRVRN